MRRCFRLAVLAVLVCTRLAAYRLARFAGSALWAFARLSLALARSFRWPLYHLFLLFLLGFLGIRRLSLQMSDKIVDTLLYREAASLKESALSLPQRKLFGASSKEGGAWTELMDGWRFTESVTRA